MSNRRNTPFYNAVDLLSRRRFLASGALAAGALGLTACGDQQTVAIQVSPTPTPTPASSPTPTPAPLPQLPPFVAKKYEPNLKNAIVAGEEIVDHFSKVLDTPSALIHAVRAFGRKYKRADGSNTVDHLCATCAEEKPANGRNLVHFKRANYEVHENSFLKTFIEAGVPFEEPVLAGANKYTLKDVADHAKLLFRIDPNNLAKFEPNYTREHLPWGLIAFSNLMKGGAGSWTNAWNEKIDLLEVVDKAALEFETLCSAVATSEASGAEITDAFHKAASDYTCFGGHFIYSLVACVANGYTGRNLANRVNKLLDLNIYRTAHEWANIEKIYLSRIDGPISPNPQEEAQIDAQLKRVGVEKKMVIQMLSHKSIVKLNGHVFESVNFARLKKTFEPNADQQKLIQKGEQKLFESITALRAMNLEGVKNFNAGQVNEVVIAVAHAVRGLKLLSAANPDTNPRDI